jgi:hypothetical protein
MIRMLIIVGAGVVGLIGLFMSLCGGGFFLMMGYDSLRSILGPRHDPSAVSALVLLLIPAFCLVVGASVFWACYKYVRKTMTEGDGKTAVKGRNGAPH